MLHFDVKELSSDDWKLNKKKLPKMLVNSILPADWSNVKILLTKVEPQGIFPLHIDDYHHVFYFIEGEGILRIAGKEYAIKPDLKVEISAGLEHGYENTGTTEMFLITVNIPQKT